MTRATLKSLASDNARLAEHCANLERQLAESRALIAKLTGARPVKPAVVVAHDLAAARFYAKRFAETLNRAMQIRPVNTPRGIAYEVA